MNIRRATADDAASLARLAAETYTETYGPRMLASDLKAHLARHLSPTAIADYLHDDVFLLAEDGDELLGFVQFGSAVVAGEDGGEGDQAIRRLYVRTAFHGQKVGKALMQAALDDSVVRAAPRVWLDVWENNLRARKFYKDFGFEVAGSFRMEFRSGPADSLELVMVRRQG